MAQLDVEKKKDDGNKWWIWVLIAIAAIVVLWFVFDDNGDDMEEPVIETAAYLDDTISNDALALTPVSEDVYRA